MEDAMSTTSVKARLKAATPGPWSQGMAGNKLLPEIDYSAAFGFIVVNDRTDDGQHGVADADFIAHAPTDLAAALKVIMAAKIRHYWIRENDPWLCACGWANCPDTQALDAWEILE
jgi:hypothetical protein